MIAENFEYAAPSTLEEALQLLADPEAKALAGGMSLIPLMKLRLAAPGRLVDLRRVQELKTIRRNGGALHIGALATHSEIESSPAVRSRCPLLAETASHIGDLQVRNMGTIGGSIAHNDPAADYPAALLALEAQVKIAGQGTERVVGLEELLVDAMVTALEPGELITEVIVPVDGEATGTSYQKMRQPASGFAIVGVAARVTKSNGKIGRARIGVTGLGPTGFRARKAEELLEGSSGSEEEIRRAAAAAAEGVEANSDLHASAEYRRHLAAVYTARAVRAALARAS